MNIKSKVGKLAPGWVVRAYRRIATGVEFFQDYLDYSTSTAWHAGSGRPDMRRDEQEALEARLTLAYHGLEKGASFPNPRRPFGLSKATEVARLLQIATKKRHDLRAAQRAHEAVRALNDFNATGSISNEVTPRGIAPIAYENEAVERFVVSRKSVRDFDQSKPIAVETVAKLIELAAYTPSVCNRRSYRAHYYSNRAAIDRILALQNGNRGFGHTVPGLFVVTERRSAFVGAGERNQRWVDGGLFAMSIVWIAHALGLSTCFLNWSQSNGATRKLRAAAGIGSEEDVVVMIAVGYARAGHRVARSPLRQADETFVHHGE